jgi:crossover junction endodeoxyribonuclease RuvC
MRTIGIDPGTAIMGWGVVDEQGGTLKLVDYGALTTPATMAQPDRLVTLYSGLQHILATYQPTAAAVEELFFSKNVTTALTVGQARGVALLAVAQAQIAIYEYKPLSVKQAVAGYGGADKKQMQEMIRITLQLSSIPRPDDAADALAVAICHAYSAPMLQKIGKMIRET